MHALGGAVGVRVRRRISGFLAALVMIYWKHGRDGFQECARRLPVKLAAGVEARRILQRVHFLRDKF